MARPLTQHCFDSLMMDEYPRPAAIVDFGLDTPNHLGALQHAIRSGATVEELDAALGDGEKLTALVERFPNNPYPVKFKTAYDVIKHGVAAYN